METVLENNKKIKLNMPNLKKRGGEIDDKDFW